MKTLIKSFAAYRELGSGIPSLRAWEHTKTMSIDWHAGGLRDYPLFNAAVDYVSMTDALCDVWIRCRSKCSQRASFSCGTTGGHIEYVPIVAGIEMVDIIRKYYYEALALISFPPGDDEWAQMEEIWARLPQAASSESAQMKKIWMRIVQEKRRAASA